MSTLPTFSSSCIAPDSSGHNAYLFGVPSLGRLEAYSVDLSNPLAPTSTFVSAITTTGSAKAWDAQYSLGCYPYLGDAAPADSSISVVQFGSGTTLQAVFSPNGTWGTMVGSTATATPGTDVDYVSPKLFSVVGSTSGWNWFLAKATTDTWRDIRIGEALETGSQDLTMAGSDPLLTVGAIAQDTGSFGNGLLFSFDQSGSAGTAYRAVGNKLSGLNLTSTAALVTLTEASAVDLNNITLTADAVPVVCSFLAVIIDKGPSGTILVLSIDPRSSHFQLVPSSVNSSAPLFLANQSFTSLNGKIVVYGGLSQDAGLINSVHIFNIMTGVWSGPGLVIPGAVGDHPKAGGLSGAVIGGIAAALVVLIAGIGAAVWRIRRNRSRKGEEELRKGYVSRGSGGSSLQGGRDSFDNKDNKDATIKLLGMDNKSQAKRGSGHAEQQQRQQQLQHKMESGSESGITLADATVAASTTAPDTPKSTRLLAQGSNTKSSSNSTHRSSRAGQPSRQPSTHSMRSASSGQMSPFPTGSSIYLVDSPSMLPPTPMVPSVYTTNAIDNFQSTQRFYPYGNSATFPKGDGPSTVTSPNANNKKGHVYKVNVPDAYDDRQPLHRRDTVATMAIPVDEQSLPHQPISTSAGSTSSPRSVSASWTTGQDPWGDKSPRQLKSRTHRKTIGGGRDDASPKIPRLAPSTSVPSSPLQQFALGENPYTTTAAIDVNRSSQQSKKKPSHQHSKTDYANLNTSRPDSGSYKIEHKNSTSPRQRQYQLQPQQQGTPSSMSPIPATTNVSPTLSNPDAYFAKTFPLPPTPKSPRSPLSIPRRSSSERNKAQQEQYMDWYQQQQQIQVENQGRLNPKTPKLKSVPRSTLNIVNK